MLLYVNWRQIPVESDGLTIFDVKLLELRLEIGNTRLKVFFIDFWELSKYINGFGF